MATLGKFATCASFLANQDQLLTSEPATCRPGLPPEDESSSHRREGPSGGVTPRQPSSHSFLEPYEPYVSPRHRSEATTPRAGAGHASPLASPMRGSPQPLTLPSGDASPEQQLSPGQQGGRQAGESALARFRAVTLAHTSAAAFRRAGESAAAPSDSAPAAGNRFRRLGLQLDAAEPEPQPSTRAEERGKAARAAQPQGSARA